MFHLEHEQLKTLGAHITTREIQQQPELWAETLQLFKTNQQAIEQFLNRIVDKHKRVNVIFTGAGTSQYAGDTVLPYLNQHGNRQQFHFSSVGTTDIVATPYEFLFKEEPTVLVSFARSGNSPESVAAVELANQICDHVYHIFITCAPNGKLAQSAPTMDNSLLLLMPERSNDAGFAMTGSFTCMTLTALLLFDTTPLATKESYVKQAITFGLEALARVDEVQAIVNDDFNRVVYLGSGSLAGLAREAQLKLLELTAGQVTTVFDSSMGFRHGPKSFVNDQTLVFVFVNNNAYTRQYDLDILNEIYSDNIAKRTIAVGQNVKFDGTTISFNDGETSLLDGYLALPAIVVAQSVSLLASIKVNNKPDTPSPTGTVNRVVKGVIIHAYDENE